MAGEMRKPSGKRSPSASRLARVASQQFGIVDVADLRHAGLDRFAVKRREDARTLHPLFEGTWAVGHRAVTPEGWWLAGVRSAGGDARIAGASGCQLYELYEGRVGYVHVISLKRGETRGRLRIEHRDEMPPMRRRKGIPVVPVEEALLGLAASAVPDRDVRRALRQAQVKKLTTYANLRRHAEAARGRRGVARFRRLLGAHAAPTRSDLEDAALTLLNRYGLYPECNVRVDGEEADMVLDGLVIELDSEAFHDNSVSAADDVRRQELWESNGRRVERLTWDDVHVTPVATVRRVARASRATRSSPPPA